MALRMHPRMPWSDRRHVPAAAKTTCRSDRDRPAARRQIRSQPDHLQRWRQGGRWSEDLLRAREERRSWKPARTRRSPKRRCSGEGSNQVARKPHTNLNTGPTSGLWAQHARQDDRGRQLDGQGECPSSGDSRRPPLTTTGSWSRTRPDLSKGPIKPSRRLGERAAETCPNAAIRAQQGTSALPECRAMELATAGQRSRRHRTRDEIQRRRRTRRLRGARSAGQRSGWPARLHRGGEPQRRRVGVAPTPTCR